MSITSNPKPVCTSLAESLLCCEDKVNVILLFQRTPLDLAVKSGHEDVAKLLKGGDVSYVSINKILYC